MNSRQYIPKPGSVPARAIAWLWTQPKGAEVTTDVLATAAGFNRRNATAFLTPAVKGLAITRRASSIHDWRAPTLWSLGPKAPTVNQIAALTSPKPQGKVRTVPRRSVFEARPDERAAAMEAPVPAAGSFLAEWRRLRGEA